MKSIFSLVLILLFAGSPGANAQQPNDSSLKQVNLILDQWHRDAANGNHEAYIGAMSTNGIYIGTDATEHWTTAEFRSWSKPFFDKKRTWNFHPSNRHIYVGNDGHTAWFDELLSTQMGMCRGSGVLLMQEGRWKIAHYVLSATIPNDLMNQVTSLKAASDSALTYQEIFDRSGMTGTILILDPAHDKYYGYNAARWDSGYLPASTFKIPNTLIALEAGVTDTGYIFKWKGEKRRLPQWEQDLTLRDAFRVSCVPCYQELARRTGLTRMNEYLDKLHYGRMDVRKENLDLFWLEGTSRITPRQQLDFVRRLYGESLPLKKTVMQAVKSIMVNEVTPEYTLSGKTGWAIRNGNNYGWFVGWLETNGNVFFVATLVEPVNQAETSDFAAARKTVTMEVFRYLGMIRDTPVTR